MSDFHNSSIHWCSQRQAIVEAVSQAGAMQTHWCSTSFNMCLHLSTRSDHTGKQRRIATLCKSIGHQARCPKPFTLRCKEDPDVAPRNQWTCLTTQQHGGYRIRALSSPCFLFFRLLLHTSSWMRVFEGKTFVLPLRLGYTWQEKISCSPRNTKGWRSCRSWFWVVVQVCYTAMFPSVRNASFMSSPDQFDLFVKSRSSRSAGEYQALWSQAGSSRVVIAPHMLWTSYFFLRKWKSWPATLRK